MSDKKDIKIKEFEEACKNNGIIVTDVKCLQDSYLTCEYNGKTYSVHYRSGFYAFEYNREEEFIIGKNYMII